MYGCTSTAIEKVRGVDDDYNMAAAAVTTGMLFKSTGIVIFLFAKVEEKFVIFYTKQNSTFHLGIQNTIGCRS